MRELPSGTVTSGTIVGPLLRFEGSEFDEGREQGRSDLFRNVVDDVLRSVD